MSKKSKKKLRQRRFSRLLLKTRSSERKSGIKKFQQKRLDGNSKTLKTKQLKRGLNGPMKLKI